MPVNTSAFDLHRMLKQIAPHVSDDDTLPTLTAVRIEAEAGNLFVLATDRYTMAVARIGTVETEKWQAYIPVESLPAVLAWLHVAGNSVVQVAATGDGDMIALTLSTATSNMRIAAEGRDYAHYPNWRKTISEQLEADMELVPMTSFTTEFLARWQDAGTVLHAWQAGPRKALVLADDDGMFLGLQMPVRWEDPKREPLINQWLAAFRPNTVTVDGGLHPLDGRWVDADGDEWKFTGQRNSEGEPLMALVDLEDDAHTFAQAVADYGMKPAA
ncbi:phiSA1p31-related protein [Streptomyces virginiae]|uniref:DNA polymerase III subunit beta family protein n=1 Tax=Streptomyces virginiae TaxID=1961 RepID=UPI003673D6FD